MRVDVHQVGPFQILHRLGSKRQKVFAARHRQQDRTSALKLIAVPPHLTREEALRRIHKEVRFLSRLRHPRLVQMFGGGVSHDQIYLEMELVTGESLSSILSRRGRLEWDVAVQYAVEIADVLEYLHSKGLTHGKLTPEKVLIADGHVKVTDLRLNRIRRRRWDAQKKAELEVAAYLAPEQLMGKGVSPQADLYSLGVIIHELVTGQLPFPPESLKQMAQRKQKVICQPISGTIIETPTWLDQVVLTLMNPDPRLRYPSAAAAMMALREIQKIDANRTSAVAQLAAGFNPLNAGADKREARQLLGQNVEPLSKPHRMQRTLSVPRWAQISGLILGLLVSAAIFVLTIYSLTPTFEDRIAAADRLLSNEQPSLLEMGNSIKQLSDLIQQYPDAAEVSTAKSLVMELETQRLLRLAEIGRTGNLDQPTRMFVKAYKAAFDEKYYLAMEGFRELVTSRPNEATANEFLYREAERQFLRCKSTYAEQVRQQLVLASKDRAVASQWAIEAKKALGADPEHQVWLTELATDYPEIQSIEPWPAILSE
ncbi:MAG: serine/threonine-protein kinase [Pirellulaceae bacterium]|nr:serine/threonine-protein kinase [Pirellulaceae bacterium]